MDQINQCLLGATVCNSPVTGRKSLHHLSIDCSMIVGVCITFEDRVVPSSFSVSLPPLSTSVPFLVSPPRPTEPVSSSFLQPVFSIYLRHPSSSKMP